MGPAARPHRAVLAPPSLREGSGWERFATGGPHHGEQQQVAHEEDGHKVQEEQRAGIGAAREDAHDRDGGDDEAKPEHKVADDVERLQLPALRRGGREAVGRARQMRCRCGCGCGCRCDVEDVMQM